MKIKELKNKIVITELDPNAEYICLVNPEHVKPESLYMANLSHHKGNPIPCVLVSDVDKAIRFVEIKPKSSTKESEVK